MTEKLPANSADRQSAMIIWSASWPLIIPVVFFVDYSRSLRFIPPAAHPLMVRLTERAAASVFLLSFGGGLAVCGILRLRRSRPRLPARVALDFVFFGILVLLPWATAVGIDPASRPNLLDLWIDHPSQAEAIPVICAILAGLTFLVLRARSQRVDQRQMNT